MASGTSENSGKINCAKFLHVAGDEALKVFNTMQGGAEFLRGRGSNVKKGQYVEKNYRSKYWKQYYFIFLQEITYSHQACIYLIKNCNILY